MFLNIIKLKHIQYLLKNIYANLVILNIKYESYPYLGKLLRSEQRRRLIQDEYLLGFSLHQIFGNSNSKFTNLIFKHSYFGAKGGCSETLLSQFHDICFFSDVPEN